MFVKVYYIYKNSPKKMRQLAGIGAALDVAVSAPVKASGTRWLEHKMRAMSKNYGLLMSHISHLVEDKTFPNAERAKFKGMYRKYRNAKYPLYLEYFLEI